MEQKIYVKEDAVIGEDRYNGGYVYALNQETREKLITQGKAEAIDFATLDANELAIVRAVNDYKTAKERIQTHPRYRDMPSEKDYQLKLLREKLDADIAKLKQDYNVELESLVKQTAQEALKVNFKPDENVTAFLDMQLTKLAYTGNMALDLELLATKVSALDDNGKMTVLSKFGQLKQAVEQYNGQDKQVVTKLLNGIYSTVSKANTSEQYDRKLMQLKALKDYAKGIDTPYRILIRFENGGAR